MTRLAFVAALLSVAPAELPPAETVLPVDPLITELDGRIEELNKLLSDEETYEKGTELKIPSAAGVIACIGHALAAHPEAEQVGADPLALRDAALSVNEAGDLAEARDALAHLEEARSAGVPAELSRLREEDETTWYDLIGSYELMEEINTRNSKIARVARRPKGKPEEAAHAVAIALLCYPMHAQAEDYVDGEDLVDYRRITAEYLGHVDAIADGVTSKDGKATKAALLKSTQSCNECHKKYRDG